MNALIDLELERLNRRVGRLGWRIELNDSSRTLLRHEDFDRRFGARSMRRAVRRYVEAPLAESLMGENVVKRDVAGTQTMVGRLRDG